MTRLEVCRTLRYESRMRFWGGRQRPTAFGLEGGWYGRFKLAFGFAPNSE